MKGAFLINDICCLFFSFGNQLMRNAQSSHTQLFHHEDLLGLVPDGVGVVEPAVIFITLLAVSQREALVCGLWQPIAVLHLEHFEVVAVPLTRILLLTSPKCSALHTISVKKNRWSMESFFVLHYIQLSLCIHW